MGSMHILGMQPHIAFFSQTPGNVIILQIVFTNIDIYVIECKGLIMWKLLLLFLSYAGFNSLDIALSCQLLPNFHSILYGRLFQLDLHGFKVADFLFA